MITTCRLSYLMFAISLNLPVATSAPPPRPSAFRPEEAGSRHFLPKSLPSTRDERAMLQRRWGVLHCLRIWSCRGLEQRVVMLHPLHRQSTPDKGLPKLLAAHNAAYGDLCVSRKLPWNIHVLSYLLNPKAPHPHVASTSAAPLYTMM